MAKSDKLSSLSIFFPAYNEAGNIGTTIFDALHFAPLVAKKYEVIVVDDGSSDDTALIVTSIARDNKHLRLISHKQNKGYGAAVKTGIKAATMDWLFFTDSDRQFRFDELPNFVKLIDKADAIIGRRLKRRDPIMRIILAQIFLKFWNFFLFGIWLRDIDCAYKLMPTKLAQSVKLVTESAITVTELMIKLKKSGHTFFESPVTHYRRQHGIQTGSNPRVILRALRESIQLWQMLSRN